MEMRCYFFVFCFIGTQFKQLVEMTAVDWPSRKERFDVVYMLLSIQYNARIMVKVTTDEVTAVDSVVRLFFFFFFVSSSSISSASHFQNKYLSRSEMYGRHHEVDPDRVEMK